MQKAARISKADFYNKGGFSNPNQYRKMSGKSWVYYKIYR